VWFTGAVLSQAEKQKYSHVMTCNPVVRHAAQCTGIAQLPLSPALLVWGHLDTPLEPWPWGSATRCNQPRDCQAI